MDFEADRAALEEYIEIHAGVSDPDEMDDELFMKLAFEYFHANPIPDYTIRTFRSAITYNRLTGEMDHWNRIPFTELYWRPGYFLNDIGQSLIMKFPALGRLVYLNPRRWLEYFGLVDPKDPGDYYMYGR